jgi:Effector Associated Constant Component 1
MIGAQPESTTKHGQAALSTDQDNGGTLVVNLQLLGMDAEPDASDRVTRQLRRELLELDVESVVSTAEGQAPSDAKGDPITIGALIVALSSSGGVLTTLIATLKEWLTRRDDGRRVSVTIAGDTIELGGTSAQERRDLIDAFIQRHTVT